MSVFLYTKKRVLNFRQEKQVGDNDTCLGAYNPEQQQIMVEWLAVWGVGQAVLPFFRPILETIAKDVAKDAAKSYVGKCFKSVFSVIHKDALTKATGLAVKELLVLIEDEFIRADIEEERLATWTEDLRRFVEQDRVCQAIADLFLEPEAVLDPGTFALAWQELEDPQPLPEGFNWRYISKRFSAKVKEIRHSSPELRETFDSLAKAQDSVALRELSGLPPGFNLDTYREAIFETYGNLDFSILDTTGPYYSNIRLWKVFVPQSVREFQEYDPQLLEIPKEELRRLAEANDLDADEQLAEVERLHNKRRRAYVTQPPKPVLKTINIPVNQRLIILGDPGSGKSCLLQYLALEWAKIDDPNLRYTAPLPLLIELRAYNRWQCPSSKGFLKYLHEASTWHRLNQQTLHHLLDQPGRVVLLLDGLDEVFDPVEREQVVNDIHRFSNEYKQVRIVVTSRVVGYKPKRLRDAEFRHFMLQDMDEEQISNFLDKWHTVTFDKVEEGKAKRERLVKAIKRSKSIGQLAGNPLLLTMMAILNRNQKLPDDRVDLYQQCSRLLLHQWDTERALGDFPGLSEEIGLREKTTILRTVAYAMQTRLSDKSRANYIDGETLEKLIEEYLRNELHFQKARKASRALVEQLRQRNFILCWLGGDSYAFVHRTFLEYFCATEIVHQFNVARTLDIDGLINLFDKHSRDDDWREVLRLICGQIDEQFTGKVIEHLATKIDWDEWEGRTPPELLLAIGCLTESGNKSKLESVGITLQNLVLEIYRRDNVEAISQVLDAVKEIGEQWPGRGELRSLAEPIIPELSYGGQLFWPQFIGSICRDQDLILSFFDHNLASIRDGAVKTLANHWPDENTKKLIVECSLHDKDKYVRSSALKELAANWPDENIRNLLVERSGQDYHDAPRSTALQALAKYWPDEKAQKLIIERAAQDKDYFVRLTALEVLAAHWQNENTRKFLKQRAIEDDSGYCCDAALQALAKYWPEHEEELPHESCSTPEDSEQPALSYHLQVMAEWNG